MGAFVAVSSYRKKTAGRLYNCSPIPWLPAKLSMWELIDPAKPLPGGPSEMFLGARYYNLCRTLPVYQSRTVRKLYFLAIILSSFSASSSSLARDVHAIARGDSAHGNTFEASFPVASFLINFWFMWCS